RGWRKSPARQQESENRQAAVDLSDMRGNARCPVRYLLEVCGQRRARRQSGRSGRSECASSSWGGSDRARSHGEEGRNRSQEGTRTNPRPSEALEAMPVLSRKRGGGQPLSDRSGILASRIGRILQFRTIGRLERRPLLQV